MIKPKKSLGQNFLRDKNILDKIIQSAKLKADSFVLEIGPGEGALTMEIIKSINKIICVEKDEYLANELLDKFQLLNFKNKATIIIGDVLEINLPDLITKNNFQKYKVVANIPYYITSPIIRLFLETKYPPEEMILMVQKEVAERICARPGKMSILAVSVQYYAHPEFLFEVPKEAFWPIPGVDSAVIRIARIKSGEQKNETKLFFRIVKAGFSAKRKTLVNNLASSFHLEKRVVEEMLKKIKIEPRIRAEDLSVDDWKQLTDIFKEEDIVNSKKPA